MPVLRKLRLRGIAAMRQCGMAVVVPISKRGTVTLPPALRRKFGLGTVANPLVLIEERDGELVLRPAAAVAVREISQAVIDGWIAEDEAGMREFEAMKRKRSR
jgi:bifunctional DNA-binding transcriptional regulator/antitoxin component of YhaV-PrlF toxin-antitoxin module